MLSKFLKACDELARRCSAATFPSCKIQGVISLVFKIEPQHFQKPFMIYPPLDVECLLIGQMFLLPSSDSRSGVVSSMLYEARELTRRGTGHNIYQKHLRYLDLDDEFQLERDKQHHLLEVEHTKIKSVHKI